MVNLVETSARPGWLLALPSPRVRMWLVQETSAKAKDRRMISEKLAPKGESLRDWSYPGKHFVQILNSIMIPTDQSVLGRPSKCHCIYWSPSAATRGGDCVSHPCFPCAYSLAFMALSCLLIHHRSAFPCLRSFVCLRYLISQTETVGK
jgi:hypothetical protein